MSTQTQPPKLSPHPVHLRQRVWQIWVPIGVATLIVLVVLAFAILSATGAGNNVGKWANISLIFLLIPAMLMTFVFLAITGGLAFLITVAIRKVPAFAYRIHTLLLRINHLLKSIGNRAASPILTVNGYQAGWRRLFNMLFRRGQPTQL